MTRTKARQIGTASAVLFGVAGATFAGLDSLKVVCFECFKLENDVVSVCSEVVICDPGSGCSFEVIDRNNDGKVDEVVARCIN